LIYEGEVGFDPRFNTKGGMWGIAIYFAENAAYSHSANGGRYRHVNDQGKSVLFLAEVILGDYILLAPSVETEQLKKPPINQANELMYDSVKGHTEGSDVYMVYLSSKVYPRYLVTYTA
jgi:hypothetical protein